MPFALASCSFAIGNSFSETVDWAFLVYHNVARKETTTNNIITNANVVPPLPPTHQRTFVLYILSSFVIHP